MNGDGGDVKQSDVRRKTIRLVVAAFVAAAVAVLLMVVAPGEAVGTQSPPRGVFWVCHNGQSIRVSWDETTEHVHHGDTEGKCPKG
jgi:hypothetical protein